MYGDTADTHLQLFSASINNGVFICKLNTTIKIGDEMDVVISDIHLLAFNECQNCWKTGAWYTYIEYNCDIQMTDTFNCFSKLNCL